MYTVPIDDALVRLPELIGEAAHGEDVVIALKDGTAVRLVPVDARPKPRFGSGRGMFTMADDFDEPLEEFEPYR